jgi:hypothetical protein
MSKIHIASEETVARNGIYLFRRFHQFMAFEMIGNSVGMRVIVILRCELKGTRGYFFVCDEIGVFLMNRLCQNISSR